MGDVAHASELAPRLLEVMFTVPSEANRYAEIDVTGWPSAGEEQLGTKPKRWLSHPDTGERWLLKYVTYSTGADGSSYRKGDDWAERIAGGVSTRLGVPTAHVELATETTNEKLCGVISKSVLAVAGQSGNSGEELVPGNELLDRPATPGVRSGYTIEAVHAALAEVEPPIGSPAHFNAWDVFAGYLVLDCLIGNTDRHEENWAVIVAAGRRRLAPSFDHASSLGFQLSDEQRSDRLATRDHGFRPEAYVRRARSPFAGKPYLIDVTAEALDRCARNVREHWLNASREIDALVEPIWRIPDSRMSETARAFADRLLRANSARLFEQLA